MLHCIPSTTDQVPCNLVLTWVSYDTLLIGLPAPLPLQTQALAVPITACLIWLHLDFIQRSCVPSMGQGTLTHLMKVMRVKIGRHLRLNRKEVPIHVRYVALHNTHESRRNLLQYFLVLIDSPVAMGVLMGSSMAHLGCMMGVHLYITRHFPWPNAVTDRPVTFHAASICCLSKRSFTRATIVQEGRGDLRPGRATV